jgi:ribonuclease-3
VVGKVPPEADSGSPPLAILEKFPGIPATRMKPLVACQQAVGYAFRNPKLLLSALTHASSADHRVVSNERMEFLGDAVLALVICQDLYERFPTLLEGELTKIKSVVVSRRTCARVSKTLGLERFLILGRGMAAQDGVPTSVLAAVFESIIAAIYQDSGLGPAREFILRTARSEIEKAAGGHHGGNYKSILQQLAQKEFGQIPTYEVLAEDGPDHSKSFKVAAVIAAQRYVPAWGANKKEAQQRAALNALSQIRGLEVPFPAA